MGSELLETEKLRLFLLSDGTQNSDNECLNRLETATELIVYKEENMLKFSICFYLKKSVPFKNTSHSANTSYFYDKITEQLLFVF